MNSYLSNFREASVHQTAGEPGGVGRRYSGLLLRGTRRPDSDCPLAQRGGRAASGQVRQQQRSAVAAHSQITALKLNPHCLTVT